MLAAAHVSARPRRRLKRLLRPSRVPPVAQWASPGIDRAVNLRTKGNRKMQIPEKASLLRIFIGEDDKANGRPLYEAIVLKAREAHLAGATALRGPLGFGRSSMLHTAKVLRLSQDLPVVVEIVDTEEKISGFLPILTELTKSC